MTTECNVVCQAGAGTIIASVITWVVVFVGWIIVHNATLARDRRREKREACRQICTSLEELQAAAIDFHTSNQFNLRASSDLGHSVEQIILRLQGKPFSELNVPRSRIKAIRQRLTEKNVDLSDFSSQSADSEIVLDVRTAISDLVMYLDSRKETVWK